MSTILAYAKINLTLEVIGQREDGYHEIRSLMQVIDLQDTLSFQLEEHLLLTSNLPELVSPDNLVVKAARLLQEVTQSKKGALISLEKGIPIASGLGGGASDAALALQALNKLWRLRLSRQALTELAIKLGSDIPFFLCGKGTALIEGRGERVTPLPPFPKHWVILIKPPIEVPDKTRRMYASLKPSMFTSGQATQRLVELYRRGKFTSSLCYNVFEKVAFSSFPGLEKYRLRFLAAGATSVHLAGAGPSLFTLLRDRVKAEEIYVRLKSGGVEAYLARTL